MEIPKVQKLFLAVCTLLVCGCQSMTGVSKLMPASVSSSGLPSQSEPEMEFEERQVAAAPEQTTAPEQSMGEDDWDNDW